MQGAERVERGGEGCCPWPTSGESQRGSAGTVDDAAGECEESDADRASDDQLVVDANVAADAGPERTNSWMSDFGQLRRNTDRFIHHRLDQIALAVALMITVKLVKWSNRWSPAT